MTNPIRYAVAKLPASGFMWGLSNEPRPVAEGWYLLKFDDEAREAIVSGPHVTAEQALSGASQSEPTPNERFNDEALYLSLDHGCTCRNCNIVLNVLRSRVRQLSEKSEAERLEDWRKAGVDIAAAMPDGRDSK